MEGKQLQITYLSRTCIQKMLLLKKNLKTTQFLKKIFREWRNIWTLHQKDIRMANKNMNGTTGNFAYNCLVVALAMTTETMG